MAASKTTNTALALVAAGGDLEALIAELGSGSTCKQQVDSWEYFPPRINLLFPFVPLHAFEATAAALTPLLTRFPQLAVGLSQDIAITRSGRNWLAQVKVETMLDMIVALQMVAEEAAPKCNDLGDRPDGLEGTMIVGVFDSEEAAVDAVKRTAWSGGELLVDQVCLLHRRSHDLGFQCVLQVGVGPGSTVRTVPAPAILQATPTPAPAIETPQARQPTYQVGNEMVRMTFDLDVLKPTNAASGAASADKMLFVVDQSYSMLEAYDQVKTAVSQMVDSASDGGGAEPDFILYSTEAAFATAREVLQSKVTCSTCFEAAFKRIQEYVQKQPIGATVRVVFMTDGADTASKNLRLAIQLFQAYLNSCRRQVILHTLGFTANHNRRFLENLRSMGATEGVYRFAEGDGLDGCFTELFDFLETTTVCEFTVADGPHRKTFSGNPTRSGLKLLFDELVSASSAGAAFDGKSPVRVRMATGEEVVLKPAPCDVLFNIKCVEETEIRSLADLNRLQSELATMMTGVRVPKAQRVAVHEARMIVQEKLDQFHELFAQVARGTATGDGITARLNSLRHEAKFCKARRAREMNKRASKNADRGALIDAQLQALPRPPPGAMDALGQELICMLSGDTIDEVMYHSHDDVMVFSVRVLRPEHSIDAPTQIALKSVCVGAYSHQAFNSTAGFTIARAGAASAHGGFADKGDTELDADVGLFLAADGQRMNGCLPLYLNEHHWARVEPQLEPMLGYFFTLDPLGYKGDQLIALFGLLGQALALRAAGEWAESEFSTWLLSDLTQLCKAVLPKARAYLASGHYTGCVRADLVDEFLASPAGRTREKTPSLFVIVGWAHVTAGAAVESTQFCMAFTEELCRRTLGFCYKGQAEMASEMLEQLVYGPVHAPDATIIAAQSACVIMTNSPSAEQAFAQYAEYKLGMLGKTKAAALRKTYQKMGPPTAEHLLDPAQGFTERPIAPYAENTVFIDGLVAAAFAKVAKACGMIGTLYNKVAAGTGIDGETKRLIVIQALQYCTNDAVNHAVSHGHYCNTFDAVGDQAAVAHMVAALHARLEQRREEHWTSAIRERNELLTAKRIACSQDCLAVAGRLIAACPTRGGGVFDRLIGLLASGQVDGHPIPLLRRKIRAVLTGRMRLLDDGDSCSGGGGSGEVVDVMSNGESWVNCPLALAEQFAEVLGEEAWLAIELDMRGYWGHVYRESDIPNRHGFCNSHPNPRLARHFKSFGVTAGAAKARAVAKAA